MEVSSSESYAMSLSESEWWGGGLAGAGRRMEKGIVRGFIILRICLFFEAAHRFE